jgi:diacylglycerol kinase family enzyme
MDLDVANAMAQLRHAPAVRIDVAELNGESFLCISNFGMPTRLTERRERLRRRPQWVRWPLLLWYMLKLLVVYPRMRITLRIDGRQYPMRTRAASVSNNQLIPGGALMPARERLDRGELGVYVARETSFWSLPRLALGLLTREWQDDDELVSFSGDRLSIDVRGKKTMAIMCDGEMRQVSLPLQYAVRPRALQVLKPRKDSS